MDLESVGGGAGAGGVIATIFAILGINRKQDKSVCNVIHKGIDDKFDAILDIVKEIKDGQNKMWDKLSERRTEYRG